MMRIRIVMAFALLSLIATSAFPQKAQRRSVKTEGTGITMQETNDIIAGDDQKRDFTKQLCALVKVEVLDEISDVDGNVMGDIVIRGSEKWIYMAKGSKNLKLILKNNLPVTVMFRDYGISALKSNRVYVLRLDVPNKAKPEEAKVESNNLQMKLNPANAKVYIWGKNQEKQAHQAENGDGMLKVYLPYGRYYYRAEADGYHSAEGEVFVDDKDRWESVNLQVIMGNITLSCPTKGVEYYVDDELRLKDKKDVNWSGQLAPGQHVVEARKKGYANSSQTIFVKANQTLNVTLDPLLTEREAKKKLAQNKKNISTIPIGSKVVIKMNDGSYLLCTWYGVEEKMAKIQQDNLLGSFLVPVNEISSIE